MRSRIAMDHATSSPNDLLQHSRDLGLRLRRAEACFWSILDTAGEAFLTVDQRGRVQLFNAAAEGLFGLTPREAVGLPVGELIRSEDGEPLTLDRVNRSLSQRFEGRGLRKGGESFVAQVALTGLEVHDQTMGILVVHDLTERIADEARRSQTGHLESIGQLAAGIAHEINTPAQFVGDNVRFLRDAVPELLEALERTSALVADLASRTDLPGDLGVRVAELSEVLEDLDMDFLAEEVPLAMGQSLDGIGRVSKIVQAMRNFSHPGSMGQTPTDLNECLRNTITVSSSAWKYQAELELELAEDLRQVVCSESELNQVFLNLIVNSSHAIAARRTEDEPLGRIHVRTWNTAEGVGISIADDGCGMPPEVQKRMFEPFFTTKGVGEGTGQGLALAHNVLSAHGGSITVASQPGEGTTMTLLLPEGSK